MGGGGIWEWGLFNLEKTMVSVLQNELEYEVEKLKYTSVSEAFSNPKHGLFHITVFSERSQGRGHAAEDQNQIRTFTGSGSFAAENKKISRWRFALDKNFLPWLVGKSTIR